MKQTVIYVVCILKTSCAQEPPVFLVHRGAGEEHLFGKARMQEIALVSCELTASLWNMTGLSAWAILMPQQLPLTHFLPKAGFGLPSNTSRP